MVVLSTDNWIKDIDTILFDKDGTIIDSHIYWGGIVEARVKAVIEKLNIKSELYEELCLAMGYDTNIKKLIENGPVGNLSRDGVIGALIDSLKNNQVDTTYEQISDIFNIVHKEYLKEIEKHTFLIPGVKTFLEKLKEHNVKMAIVTSDAHANAVAILKYLQISDYFDLVIGKDDCSKEKKTGEPARLAINTLNSKPESSIVVGDAKMDYLLSKNGNLKGTLLVSTGQTPLHSLKKYVTTVVNSLDEIKVEIVNSINKSNSFI